MKNSPIISVVIPMYNVEKYIGECLKSVLMQTFQDYEVILVNDCSTDNSRQIAESYLEKFGGRLKIYDNRKNLGSSATRNRGLILSRGEYVFFMDSDDLILLNALEEMYDLAEKYNVDFVNCTANYAISEDGKDVALRDYSSKIAPKILFEDDPQWGIKHLLQGFMTWTVWRRFLKRTFLIENELFFSDKVNLYEDQIWTFGLYLSAGKVVHVPKAYYLYRLSPNSMDRKEKNTLEKINDHLLVAIDGIKWIDDIMARRDFFKKNPEIRHAILEKFTKRIFLAILNYSQSFQQFQIYESIKRDFGKKFGGYDVLVSELITFLNAHQKTVLQLLTTVDNQREVIKTLKESISELIDLLYARQKKITELEEKLKTNG